MNERIMKIATELRRNLAWDETPQGYGYWKCVYETLIHLAAFSPPSKPDQLTIDGWDLT